jgi:hypothetical protein
VSRLAELRPWLRFLGLTLLAFAIELVVEYRAAVPKAKS